RDGFGPKLAFVLTAPEPHRYGIARMVQVLVQMKGFDVEIFSDVDDALAWAGKGQSSRSTA
ncbi:MAG: hypothetical protein ACRENH_07435, partial [Gemmatimonadaceae bacterium]